MNARTMSVAQLRVPPHSNESESSVLGGLLLDETAWDRVGNLLTEAHFYRYEHKLIFGAIAHLSAAGKEVDVVTVYHALEENGKGEEVGGLAYLNSLAQFVPSAANISVYAEIVAENALLRGLATASDEIARLAFAQDGKPVAQRLDEAQQALQAVQMHGARNAPHHVGEIAMRMAGRIDALYRGEVVVGIPTRFPGLDRLMTGGLKPGRQIVLAARPSIGKSSLALAILLNVAQQGHPAAMLSQEMPEDELADRAAANLGEIDLERIQTGKLDGAEWDSLTRTIEQLHQLPLYIDEQASLSLSDIQAKARMLVRQHGIKVLVIDYLQLCAGNPKADKRHHQIEEISRGTKVLAKQLGITVILLSQLGRDVERRTSGKPVLSDLKESGSIEEDADVVGLLSVAYTRPSGVKVLELDLAKNRQGRKDSVMLAFEGEYQRWRETIAEDRPLRPAAKHYTEEV